MGATRGRRTVLVRRRARPRRLRQLRAVRGACRCGRRHSARPARDHDCHRAAPTHRPAREAGGVRPPALRRTADARACRGRPHRGLRGGARGVARTRPEARGAARLHPRRGGRGSRWAVPRGDRAARRRALWPGLLADGPLRRRLRPRRRAAPGLRLGRGAGRGRLERPWSARPAQALGTGLLHLRGRRARPCVPARLLRVHGRIRRADRRRKPHEPGRAEGLRPRLRGGRLRRARPLLDDARDRGVRAAPGGARVKVEIVGGGPAGLYLAILLKKAARATEVRVLERNAPDATFGWGVVFSEETLGALRDADPESHLEITDTFARWNRLDIRFRGRELRSTGHSFSAIARRLLLELLQRRCQALGVELEFGVEVEELPEADLVVGADGANSLVRRLGEFGTRVEPEGSKYVWFGTDLVFDAFTFIFKETEHGLFNVHAYPYDERMSTFIVECPGAVWRAAGVDGLDEQESLAFCEQLFARDLRGRELFSNRSLWLDFPKVTNRVWHDGRVVLLGDAARTAHFSIGSGTKLAMEDAIALANSLVRRGWDVESALVDYELERSPVVERTQAAASDSAAYFARVASYAHLEPVQFAFNLLTRSGRITHASLGIRDPQFTRSLDAWVGGTLVAPPPAFAPLELRGVRFENRFGLAPSGFVAVSPEGRISEETPVVHSWTRPEGPVLLQLGHAGRRGSCRPASAGRDLPLPDGWPIVAPSQLPYGPFSPVPDRPNEREVLAQFVAAAKVDADVLELDMAHGYLLGSYLSPLTNPEEDRLRFPLEVLEAVRGVWAGPLAVRLSITDWHPRGNSVEEGIAIARALGDAGTDLIHVEAGQTVHDDLPEYRRGFLTALSDRVRNEARVPTIVGGYLTTLDEANTIVGAGRADLVLLDLPEAQIERSLDTSNKLLLAEVRP